MMKVVQGLSENKFQFWLLVVINAFVGAMLGLERSVIPAYSDALFQQSGYAILLSFIVAFGLAKAFANLMMGMLTHNFTRKKLLIAGWFLALPVPLLLIFFPSPQALVVSNIFLGLSQGLAWSSTVVMKIDLVGAKNRGFAMGLNEFAGYFSLGIGAMLAGFLASKYGPETAPFIPGIGLSIAGLLLSIFLVKDTRAWAQSENASSSQPIYSHVWIQSFWKHINLAPVTWGGFVNNLNDGVIWGLLPLLLIKQELSNVEIGLFAAIYPVSWGLGQLFTGKWGDVRCKKQLLSGGMWLQAAGMLGLSFYSTRYLLVLELILIGVGTALVYPNFITVVAENTHPQQRPLVLGIFRFWRDLGYVAGALLAGWISLYFGISTSFIVVALLTAISGIWMEKRMCCSSQPLWKSAVCKDVW
jgi:MFS family permease